MPNHGLRQIQIRERTRKANKGGGHQTKTKEIRLRPKTGQHDIDFKVKKAAGFLAARDKVQVSVVFRGREIVHIEEGRRVMEGVVEALVPEHGKIEISPTPAGPKNHLYDCTEIRAIAVSQRAFEVVRGATSSAGFAHIVILSESLRATLRC